MKTFMFHTHNKGLGLYRIWQPAKWLSRQGIEVSRLADEEDWMTKGENWMECVREDNDLLLFQHRTSPSSCAIAVMSRYFEQDGKIKYLKPLVVDIDDDMLNIDHNNANAAQIHAGKQINKILNEIPKDQVLEVRKKEKELQDEIARKIFNGESDIPAQWKLMEKNGRYYQVWVGFDPVKNFMMMVKHSDCLIVSTPKLKELYAEHCERVEVIPNGIDFEVFPHRVPNLGDTVRIGLFGGSGHYSDWKLVNETIREIIKRYPKVVFVTNSFKGKDGGYASADYFKDLEGHPQVEFHPVVKIQDYYKWLADKRVDIGLAPLEDTKFNEGKSNLKYLEFGALKTPCVFSDTVSYESVINGKTGYKASNSKDWLKYISRLVEDGALRKSMGLDAYNHIKKEFNMDVISQSYAEILLNVEDKFKKTKFLKQTDAFERQMTGGKK